MRQTPRNVLFILQQHRKNVPAHVIYHRCAERLVWDGPLPSVADILSITRSPAAKPVEPGPAEKASRPGTAIAGAAGPGVIGGKS